MDQSVEEKFGYVEKEVQTGADGFLGWYNGLSSGKKFAINIAVLVAVVVGVVSILF